jgi:hypothetical protein
VTITASSRPSVSTTACRLRPLTSLPPSKPRLSASTTASALTDWESITPALGSGSRPALDQVAEHTGGTAGKALVDQGFKNQFVAHGAGLGIDVEIVEHKPQERGFVPQPKRWKVEQIYAILILHRRLARDYEHRPASSASRILWAMTHVVVCRLTGANPPTWREAQAVIA